LCLFNSTFLTCLHGACCCAPDTLCGLNDLMRSTARLDSQLIAGLHKCSPVMCWLIANWQLLWSAKLYLSSTNGTTVGICPFSCIAGTCVLEAPGWHVAPVRRFNASRIGVPWPTEHWKRHHGKQLQHLQCRGLTPHKSHAGGRPILRADPQAKPPTIGGSGQASLSSNRTRGDHWHATPSVPHPIAPRQRL